jgi:hypothetical protein
VQSNLPIRMCLGTGDLISISEAFLYISQNNKEKSDLGRVT